MKEAMGGVFSLEFIIVFLVLLNGYMAFNVNYTKAFRVKNEIRSIIQKNEGLTSTAMTQIDDYMKEVKYNQDPKFNDWCRKKDMYVCTTTSGRSFCMDVVQSDKYGTRINGTKTEDIGAYYKVTTFVDINIPLINRLFDKIGGIFEVNGETSLIYTVESAPGNGGAFLPTNEISLGSGNCSK